MKKLLLKLTAISLFCLVAACSGPPDQDVCIPLKEGTSAPKDSPIGYADKIDKFMQDNKVITTVVGKVKEKLIGSGTGADFEGSSQIFNAFITSSFYQSAVSAAFVLFVIIYGFNIVVGISQPSIGEAAIRVAKMAIVSTFAMNWSEFYGTIGSFFINFTDEMMLYFMDGFQNLYNLNSSSGAGGAAGAGAATGGAGLGLVAADQIIFQGLDTFIARICSMQTFAILTALFSSSGGYSVAYGVMLATAIFFVLQSVLKVVSIYVFSLFARALLFAVAPIFLVFLLFNQTKNMFDSWLKQMVSYSLQPVLAAAFIGLFASLLTPFFDEFAQYKMCWRHTSTSDPNSGAWKFVVPDPNDNSKTMDVDFGSNSKPPIHLQTLMIFMFFAWLFQTYLKLIDSVAIALTATYSGNLGNMEGLRALAQGGASNQMNNLFKRL